MAIQQHEEGMRLAALLEHIAVLGVMNCARLPQHVIERVGRKMREKRKLGDQRAIDRGHFHSVPYVMADCANLDCTAKRHNHARTTHGWTGSWPLS